MRRALAACALALGSLGCTSFPVIPGGECGNAVLEDGEDCDTFSVGKGTSCRPPGSEGECRYDCRTDGDGQRPNCPESMGCAADGICRPPTQGWEPKLPIASDASSWVSSIDFDGDGRREVISAEPADQRQLARFRLHYFDAQGHLSETRVFPRSTTRPLARDVDHDGREDLVFNNERIGMVPGRADRDWVPSVFTSYVVRNRLQVLSVRDDLVGDTIPIVALTDLDGMPGVYVPDFTTVRLERRAELPAPVEELLRPSLSADLVEGRSSPCQELVLAYAGSSRLFVFDMCTPSGAPELPDVVWRDQPIEQIVELPQELSLDSAPLSGDVNGDGHLDVVFGASGAAYVVFGDGKRLGDGVSQLELPQQGFSIASANQPLPEMPLAIGDVTGDGFADYVLPRQVYSSRQRLDGSGVVYGPSYDNRRQPWTFAEIADLNGNGLPDIVAASAGTPGITFLNGTGTQYQVAARLSTPQAVRLVDVGDYDGDLLNDLAFIEEGPGDQSKSSLLLAFGVRDGLPLVTKRIAEIEGVDQLGATSIGAMDQLYVGTNVDRDGAQRSTFTLFDGGPDRLPFATYTLVTFAENDSIQGSDSVALSLGSFTAPGNQDLVAVGVTGSPGAFEWSLWLIPEFGSDREPPRLLRTPEPGEITPILVSDDEVRLSAAGLALDLDGDGLDESLWMMREGEDRCALSSYRIEGDRARPTTLRLDAPCPAPALAMLRESGPGAIQALVALVGDPDRNGRRLQLIWLDGSSDLTEMERSLIEAPIAEDIRAFAKIPKRPQLAVLTASGLYVATFAGYEVTWSARIEDFNQAQGLTVTDPNADGVPDIVVADRDGLWLSKAELR